MSKIKTHLFKILVLVWVTAPAHATPDLHQTFAECVGRISAEMEHAWLMSDPAADQLKAERLTFLSLLDATLPSGAERAALSRRIDAKLAHAALLTRATFGTLETQAVTARKRATWHLATCRQLLLDG